MAELEALYEKAPIPVFNEIRAFTDHLSRCYRDNVDEKYIREQLSKARNHLVRAIFDCFKYINVYYYKRFKKTDRLFNFSRIREIDFGDFKNEYDRLHRKAFEAKKNAKKFESKDRDQSFKYYEEAYNTFVELEDHLAKYQNRIKWKLTYSIFRISLKVLGYLVIIVLTFFASKLINCEQIYDLLINLF